MFNNRDLYILGGGALLAVLCLFLPLSFVGKVVVAFLVLIGFMVFALLRLGPDRVPPEVWMMRRFRYAMQTRQYVNQQGTSRRSSSEETSKKDSKLKKDHDGPPETIRRPSPEGSIPAPAAARCPWHSHAPYPWHGHGGLAAGARPM
jgi:hypothetical protein